MPALSSEEIVELEDDEFEAHWDDRFANISRVYSLRPGHVLTQEDFDAIQAYDEQNRKDEETATSALHAGYMQGLREGGSTDIEKMEQRNSRLLVEKSVEYMMRRVAENRLKEVRQHVKDFLHALDRGYLNCKDDSAFIDALRTCVSKPESEKPSE